MSSASCWEAGSEVNRRLSKSPQFERDPRKSVAALLVASPRRGGLTIYNRENLGGLIECGIAYDQNSLTMTVLGGNKVALRGEIVDQRC